MSSRGYPLDIPDEDLREMYREMVFARHLDKWIVSLQRQGQMRTYPLMSGEEGAHIGNANALDDDWIFD